MHCFQNSRIQDTSSISTILSISYELHLLHTLKYISENITEYFYFNICINKCKGTQFIRLSPSENELNFTIKKILVSVKAS